MRMLRAMLQLESPTTAPPIDALAEIFKASGDPLRAQILRIIQRDSFSVQELCQVFGIRQPAMSHHLKVLSNAGLVTTRREGNTLFYRRICQRDDAPLPLLDAVFEAIDATCLPEEVEAGLERVRRDRAERSRQFFVDNADRFREQQDLIAAFPDYGGAVIELVGAVEARAGVAIDVGCGHGELLPALAARYERVIAVDIAAPILETAQQKCRELELDNVEFRLGDVADLADRLPPADLVTCNMVLHHISTPRQMIARLASLLGPSGSLLLTDLCQHDQDWARTSCGDQWLGFEPDELGDWARGCGLDEARSQYLAMRNGFRVQLRHFYPSTTGRTQSRTRPTSSETSQ